MNKSLIIAFLLLLIWIMSCSEETNPVMTGNVPVISEVRLAANWNTSFARKYKAEVWVKDPQGAGNLKGVYLTVHESSGDKEIFSDSLYDDGAHFNPNDGDVIAKDGVFSNRFLASEVIKNSSQNDVIFRFIAYDKQNNVSQQWDKLITFSPNSPPAINQIFAPDSLSFMDENIIFSITVSDSDGIEDIVRAYFQSEKTDNGVIRYEQDLFNDGDFENNGDLVAGDSTFSARITKSLLVAKKGIYNLIFHVEDLSETQNVTEAKHQIYIENFESRFIEINTPNELAIPTEPDQQIRELITVEVSDPEGLTDIDSVYFFSLKPDSTLAQGGLPFIMVDNGLPFNPNGNVFLETGDEEYGDGIYSLSIFSDFSSNPGEYTFLFYIRDRAGNLTGPVERKIQLTE
jgi:hypothetical protein